MEVNPEIFKAYDIRGIYKKDFDEQTAYRLGLAYVKFRQQELNKTDIKIVVSCDMRLSSPALKQHLMKGLTEAGASVIDIGLQATPTFYFAVAHYKYDGGIIVSASHNPKDYNGFKLVREKALPIGAGSGMEEIKRLVLENDFSPADLPGRIVIKREVLLDQIKHDLQYVDVSKIKPLKIVIDPANAMGSTYFNELFKHLPCQVIKMNWQLDGNFPAHEADPFKPENIKYLADRVMQEEADLGIATDGDGDRIFFVDDLGEAVEAGVTRAIMCKLFLAEKPGAKIAYDIRPGRITRDVIEANGGVPIVTKVGHSLIKQRTVEEGAYFAGESSGHFFLNMDGEGCYEVPMIVALKILQELSVSGSRFSHYITSYQKYYHSGEINSQVLDAELKLDKIKAEYSDGQLNELDGITIEYPDFWFNVRLSNTESLLRLNVEAKTRELMQEKRDELLKIIRD